ncbi:SMP-30/gluconolactonase/LRE family protein [Ohtaekwangia koreensis]|uniref:Gluconolactonase n=1 Tax=Ohtaekwangia koreensis TaxID=688867 RepID=A0A1T5K019_9BACT|nr:SMP-30/gluconolactonase/LRE family protein [Ohtaekwangia koreensis]SKC56986.1 gluconolactonase [Ohtaekwangia koreensis]
MKPLLSILALFIFLSACKTNEMKTIGSIERVDPALDAIISANAQPEIIAEGFEWSEGPLWLEEIKTLIFSDVPKNIIHQWSEQKGLSVYLTPSGYTSSVPRGGEMGSNGLTLTPDGKLVLCQHGDRRVAVMNAPVNDPKPDFTTISDNIDGKKLSSPNDAVVRSNGDVFFTDPPYGLPKQAEDPTKETPYNGVYKASGGKTILLVDSLTRPNGIAFLPGEKTFIVANSDSDKAIWYAFDLNENDSVTNARIFYDATAEAKKEKGLPDGFKVDKKGNIYASGPGGLWIFNAEGKVLGKIKIPEATSNCALSADEKTLYLTADMYVIRVRLRE